MRRKIIFAIATLIGLFVVPNCVSHLESSSSRETFSPPIVSEPQSDVTPRQQAGPLYFLNKQVGWAVCKETLYATLDGGKNWKVLNRAEMNFSVQLTFANESQGWAIRNEWAGQHGHLALRTEDGGRTWREVLRLESPILGVAITANNVSVVRSRWDNIRQTSDNGKTWKILDFSKSDGYLNLIEGLQGFFFVTENEAWGYGSSIWRTEDGAITWKEVVPDKSVDGLLSSATFLDKNTGWIVGSGREVWRTTDGRTWQRATFVPLAQGSPQETTKQMPSRLYSVTFINSRDGWLAADDKTVLHSGDGGVNWEVVSRLPNVVAALRFLSETDGWAIDHEGRLLHTTDSGKTWNIQSLP